MSFFVSYHSASKISAKFDPDSKRLEIGVIDYKGDCEPPAFIFVNDPAYGQAIADRINSVRPATLMEPVTEAAA